MTDTTEATPASGPDFLRLARDAFTSSTTFFDSSIRAPIEAALRQFQGVHPVGSKYHSDAYKGKSKLFSPKTRSAVRKNEAVAAEAFFSTADVVTVTCEDDDNPKQRASAAVKQALVNYRLKKSIPWFVTLLGAYQSTQVVGVCISHQYWQYDPKRKLDKPCIDLVPVENLRIDPGSDWADPINTSPFVIHMLPMRVMDVRARMKNPDPTTGQPRWFQLPAAAILAATQSYSDTTRQTRERGRTDSKEQSGEINDFAIVWVHRNIISVDGDDMVFYTLGTQQMLSNPVPLRQAYFHNVRPYVMGYCVLEAHKIYPDGPVGISKDVQTAINNIQNQRQDNVKLAMDKRYFVKRGKQVDTRSLTRNTPGSVTMMDDPEKDVVVQSTPDVTHSAYEEQDRLNLDFDEVTGNFSQSSVQSNRQLNETVGGMNLLTTNANQVGTYQLRTFVETWVEPVLNQVVLLEEAYETDETVLMLASKAAKLEQSFPDEVQQPGFLDDLMETAVTLNVNVGIGATNPHEKTQVLMNALVGLRDLLADGVLEKYGMDVSELFKIVFGNLGYKDGDRFFGTEDEDPRITSAKATIQQLQQQLEQKVSPELVAAQIDKINAEIKALGAKTEDTMAAMVKKNMETFFAGMQAAQVAVTIPGAIPIADAMVEEAGFQARPGVDPNFVQPEVAVVDPSTAAAEPDLGAGDTSPLTPADPAEPASPFEGETAGIDTMRSDSTV